MNPAIPSTPLPLPRGRTVLKMLTVVTLILLGLIPLALIRGVLLERRARHQEAVANITSTWGNPQVLAGPILSVPYRHQVKTWKDQQVNGRLERIEVMETVVSRGWFLPAELSVAGDVRPDVLHRGIYEAVVYRTSLQFTGRFDYPSFAEWKVAPEDVLWDDARLFIAISDLRGVSESLQVTWDDAVLSMVPAGRSGNLGPAIQASFARPPFSGPDRPARFEFAVNLNGSRSLSFAPLGMQTRVKLTSPFPDPSFQGAFLPAQRKVGPDGFEADWLVGYYGRGYPQQWTDRDGDALEGGVIASSLLGVSLEPTLDSYRYVERSIKYGVLFLGLVFTAFFLFEVRAVSAPVHPFQYALVGAALCLFYLAILSLSEFISFGWAYLTGAAAATALVTFYTRYVLRGMRQTWWFGGGLAAVYGFLYLLLREQDYSLLYGTVALFVVLAAVMYATRNIDWYARDRG